MPTARASVVLIYRSPIWQSGSRVIRFVSENTIVIDKGAPVAPQIRRPAPLLSNSS
jgi:hypothetical protein